MSIKLPRRDDRPSVDPENPFDGFDASERQDRRHARWRGLHPNLNRMQASSTQPPDDLPRISNKYMFYNGLIRQRITENPSPLNFNKHGAVAKSAFQKAQPTNFGGISEHHDGPADVGFKRLIVAKRIHTFALILHILNNQKEENKY